jgi:CheY-like chemotaxis protein
LVVLRTPHRDNADALADALNQAGRATAWHRHDRTQTYTRGAVAGIWDGGQLSDSECADLEVFCKQMSRDGAPVIVLLDFPRRDCVDRAYKAGARAVLGKPWFNTDLITALEAAVEAKRYRRAA